MNPKDFAAALMRSVVDENAEAYRDIFENNSPDEASDPYWQRALALYNDLLPHQRTVLFEIMRQVAVDTISNVLGVIDGVSSLDDASDDFALIYGREKLNGDLQSLFLVEDEKLPR